MIRALPCQINISIHGAGWRESAVNRMIGVDRTKRYELIATNQIEVVKLGKSTGVTTASLHALIKQLRGSK